MRLRRNITRSKQSSPVTSHSPPPTPETHRSLPSVRLSDLGDSSKLKVANSPQHHRHTWLADGYRHRARPTYRDAKSSPTLSTYSSGLGSGEPGHTHTHSLIQEVINMAPYSLTSFFSTPPSPLVPAIHSQGSPSLSPECIARPPKGGAGHPHTPHQSL